jgi:Leucine-rich repeat (LRR) protein
MPHCLNSCLAFLVLILISACESYDFRVNDKLVYSPQPLFSDFAVPDAALAACLEQAITDGKIASASALTLLNCSHAGVNQLAGLEIFTGLSQLKLSANNIGDISPLIALTSLEILLLDNNQVIDATPLIELPALQVLDLAQNKSLLCPAAASFITVKSLSLPAHCG